MHVGVYKVLYMKPFALYEAVDGAALLRGGHSGVDYGAFPGGRVVDDICVYAEEGKLEYCYFHLVAGV